ncbi:AAA family ATPase (plasmid) [Bacillus mycoides]|uniref:McrB family protein n=1 Tax=Bacillus mycoides TaxID=1405 RepID=UPI0025710B54|nr:AAA family ATPase [Bacillus mycoides]WJE74200.1 AAA family ATPase [Bacillus mycoides]
MSLIDHWTVPITSSNVHGSVKKRGLTGNGEITIYFGQGDETEERFRNFFNVVPGVDERGRATYTFSDQDVFYFSKQGLINYLYSVQFEYNYQIIGQYNEVSFPSWEQKLETIKNEQQEEIIFPPRCVINPTNTQGKRLYLKSSAGRTGSFIRNMRIPLAEITEVTVNKYEEDAGVYRFEFIFKLKMDLNIENPENNAGDTDATADDSLSEIGIGQNLIVYGAPGTGKSHYLNGEFPENRRRVTFHPEYTYQDFVGSYKPVPVYRQGGTGQINDNNGEIFSKGEPLIDYRFTPGPFTLALSEALQHEDKMYTLIIEELNRANAPAVFGDLFQLLDREDDGNSTYSVTNVEIANYLRSIEGIQKDQNDNEISIPFNLNIVATMNSADQGVFVMDSAFKRRWNFEYRPIDIQNAGHKNELIPYGRQYVKWGEFIGKINGVLSDGDIRINEDKHVGPYFIKPADLEGKSDEQKQGIIASKLLIYLWDDVVRHKRTYFFENPTTFSDLVVRYKDGELVFKCEFPMVLEQEENNEPNNSDISGDTDDRLTMENDSPEELSTGIDNSNDE